MRGWNARTSIVFEIMCIYFMWSPDRNKRGDRNSRGWVFRVLGSNFRGEITGGPEVGGWGWDPAWEAIGQRQDRWRHTAMPITAWPLGEVLRDISVVNTVFNTHQNDIFVANMWHKCDDPAVCFHQSFLRLSLKTEYHFFWITIIPWYQYQ